MSNTNIQTGSYAVTTVYSMPWAKKKRTVKKVDKKQTKKIVHELFLQVSEISDDPYWQTIFKNCAINKFPRGFFYTAGMMTHRKGKKVTRKEIPSDPYEAYETCTAFFKDSAGILSPKDKVQLQKEEEEKVAKSMYVIRTWKDVKSDKLKNLLINNYVNYLCDKHNYDNEQKKYLKTTIRTGILLKYFNEKNIIIHDGRIKNIEGLIYDEDKAMYIIDPYYFKIKPKKM